MLTSELVVPRRGQDRAPFYFLMSELNVTYPGTPDCVEQLGLNCSLKLLPELKFFIFVEIGDI